MAPSQVVLDLPEYVTDNPVPSFEFVINRALGGG